MTVSCSFSSVENVHCLRKSSKIWCGMTKLQQCKSTSFFLILEIKKRHYLRVGRFCGILARWENQPGFRWHTYSHIKYLADIENGQQSSGKCDNVKSFCETYQKICDIISLQFPFFRWNILNRSKLYRFVTGTIGLFLTNYYVCTSANSTCSHVVSHTHTQKTVAGVMDVFGFVSLDTWHSHTYLRLMTTFVHVHRLTQLIQYSSVVLPP